eukprot:GCRY01000209.1.p1 GENE.GCRY01000209.1~~GCRY01000209.1.p1  ORF type:complete len:252 (+),score=30.84 GCRY01000209.1:70-825(+)
MRFLCILGVFALLAACAYAKPMEAKWDYFLLAMEWPGGASSHYFDHNVTTFTLHGLWPTRNDGSWPAFCDKSDPYDPSQFSDLLPLMMEYWPSYTRSNDVFWQHEWEKHGTCAKSVSFINNQHDYFQATLKIAATLNLTDALANHGIVPGKTNKYQLKDYEKAAVEGLGVTPGFGCAPIARPENSLHQSFNSFKHKKKPDRALMNVFFCVDKNFELFECEGSVLNEFKNKANCMDSDGTGNVYFEPIPYEH